MHSLNRLILLAFFMALPLWCQTYGEISGVVRDTNGGAIVGANVTLTNLATNGTRKTATNEAGLYNFPHKAKGKCRSPGDCDHAESFTIGACES